MGFAGTLQTFRTAIQFRIHGLACRICHAFLIPAVGLFSCCAGTAGSPPDPAETGRFITCLAADAKGNIWIGAEEWGLSLLTGDRCRRFTCEDGLPDNSPTCLALIGDTELWAGFRRDGVARISFQDGRLRVCRYGVLDGIGGVCVSALVRTEDGEQVWCATENGAAFWDGGKWHPETALNSLFSGRATDIFTGPDGSMFCTGADGGLGERHRWKWKPVRSAECLFQQPLNRGFATEDGDLWLTTPDGILCRRGKRGRFQRIAPTSLFPGRIREDYATCAGEGPDGSLLFGTRKHGLLILAEDRTTWQLVGTGTDGPLPDSFVSCVLTLPNGGTIVGTYGGGAVRLDADAFRNAVAGKPAVPVPLSADRPAKLPRKDRTRFVYIGEDRETRGDWIGCYGRNAWVLAAAGLPHDVSGGPGIGRIGYRVRMGDGHKPGDAVRYWMHDRNSPSAKSLQYPHETGTRRQSSWDDAGELYPPDHPGPNLLLDLDLPPGKHLVSLYFVNIDCLDCPAHWRTSDGFRLPNRFRDYRIEVKAQAATEAEFEARPLLAGTRVCDFNAGVYKRFAVQEGGIYTLRISRGFSHNTVLSGVFIDPCLPDIAGSPSPADAVLQCRSGMIERAAGIKLLPGDRGPDSLTALLDTGNALIRFGNTSTATDLVAKCFDAFAGTEALTGPARGNSVRMIGNALFNRIESSSGAPSPADVSACHAWLGLAGASDVPFLCNALIRAAGSRRLAEVGLAVQGRLRELSPGAADAPEQALACARCLSRLNRFPDAREILAAAKKKAVAGSRLRAEILAELVFVTQHGLNDGAAAREAMSELEQESPRRYATQQARRLLE